MEGSSLEKKLLANFTAAFTKDPNIDEYDFLPVLEPIKNSNPIVTVEHKVGIELWAAKILFNYAYKRLMSATAKRKGSVSTGNNCEDLLSTTSCVLIMNADCLTAWNLRKAMVKAGKLSIRDDLQFGKLVLGKHPKSPETFTQRKWLVTLLKEHLSAVDGLDNDRHLNANAHILGEGLHTASTTDILNQETQVAQRASEKYANNYNAWNYRVWLLDIYNAHVDFILMELAASEKWVAMHVSDHSGFHYRQNLLGRLKKSDHKDCLQLLQKELSFTAELIARYEGHEAVWYHRRWVLYQLHQFASAHETTEHDAKRFRLDSGEKQISLDTEKAFCGQIRCNFHNEWQLELLNRHEKWIDRNIAL